MPMHKIKVPFSKKGINKLYAKIELFEQKLPELKKMFYQKSLDDIKYRAILRIDQTTGNSDWYQLTGELKNSFDIDYQLGTLINHCYYASFVEYGTGIVGEGTHPDSKGYSYDTNGRGEAGWFFFDDEGTLHWTQGMEAHAFLYEAVEGYLRTYNLIFEQCFREVLGEVFK